VAILYTNLPKPAWDERRIAHDFADDLAVGDTIASIDSISVSDADTGADITASAKSAASNQIDTGNKSVSAIYKGGTPGQKYRMVARVVTTNGEKLSAIIQMEIE
jgi:hypothetical protein